MIPGVGFPRLFPTVHCDEPAQSTVTRTAVAAKDAVLKQVSAGETELRRWKRSFEAHAKDTNGQK